MLESNDYLGTKIRKAEVLPRLSSLPRLVLRLYLVDPESFAIPDSEGIILQPVA